jgi:NitT/TauT family transport system permease protein
MTEATITNATPPAPSALQVRPEITRKVLSSEHFGIVEQRLGLAERLFNQAWLRKLLLLAVLAGGWELYARQLDNELLLPTFSATITALFTDIFNMVLPERAWVSLKVLLIGYAAGILLAAILSMVAIGTRLGRDLLETLTAMMNPLPAIALLPLALIWFGLGSGSLIFVLIHSVLWPVSLNMYAGFRSASQTLKMVGRNYDLRGLRLAIGVLIPAAFPSILAGLKIGWAFAWRTLIAAELVFGVSSGSGGLGWYIYENKNQLNIPEVFAGLLSIILIGLLVENVVFRTIENATVSRWGMNS